MNKKVNKLYTVFTDAVILSDSVYLNAIEGFDVIDKGRIMADNDLATLIGNKSLSGNIAESVIYKYSNPVTSELWFLSNYFIAYSRDDKSIPEILMVVTRSTCITKSITVLNNFQYALGNIRNIKIVSSLGYLSSPTRVILNACCDNYKCDKVKLPVII